MRHYSGTWAGRKPEEEDGKPDGNPPNPPNGG